MGYETIQRHRRQLDDKMASYEKLLGAAKAISTQMDKILQHVQQLEKEQAQMVAVLDKVAADMDKLDTKGIKEFEDYHKSLVAISQGGNWRPLPTKPLDAVISKMRADIANEQWAWIDKLTANAPAEIKPGMVFANKQMGWIYEIKSGPTKAQNTNLRGDDGIFFQFVRYDKDDKKYEGSISKSDLSPKKGIKFIRA